MRLLTLICSLFLTLSISAQFCGRVEYGGKDGIVQAHYKLLCDSKGRIWLDSRGGGLNYFDGKKWTNVKEEEGLGYSWCKPMFEDKEGGIWITHLYYNGATRYLNGKYVKYKMPDFSLKKLNSKNNGLPVSSYNALILYDTKKQLPIAYQQDSTKQIWLYKFNYQNQSFDEKGTPFFDETFLKMYYKDLPKYNKKYRRGGFQLDWNGDYCVVINKENYILYLYPNGNNICLPYNNLQTKKIPFVISDGNGGYDVFKNENGKLWQKKEDNWEKFPPPDFKRYGNKSKKPRLSFLKWFISTKRDGNDDVFSLWKVNERGFENAYILAEHKKITHEIVSTVLFKDNLDFKIFYVEKDQLGTYWYCNGQEVIRLFPNQMHIPKGFQGMPPEAWSVVQANDSSIYFASYQDGIVRFDGFFIDDKLLPKESYKRFMDGSEKDDNGNIFFTHQDENLHDSLLNSGIIKLNSELKPEVLCEGQLGFFLGKNQSGELLYGTAEQGLWVLPEGKRGINSEDWRKLGKDKGLILLNVLTALEDKSGKYWMGRGSQGIAVYDPKQDSIFNWIKNDSSNIRCAQSMALDSKGNLWFGTDKGLYFYENNHAISADLDLSKLMKKVAPDYIGESLVQVCKLYDENNLIIGNSDGFFLVDLKKWYSEQLFIQSYDHTNGHLGEGITQNGVWIDNNKDVWLMCTNGPVRFSPNLIVKDTIVPTIKIEKVVGDSVYTDFSKRLKLKNTKRNLRIYFSHSSNPLLLNNIRFKYRLNDGEWSNLTSSNFADFLYLPSGKEYTFEVVLEKNGLASESAKLNFYITPFFWQKPEFWVLLSILVISFGIYLFRKERQNYQQAILIEKNNLIIEQNKTQLAKIAKEKDQLRVEAIVNQLNPHFIHNVLHWIQNRLAKLDDKDGVKVIDKFSQNIVTVFKNTREKKPYHTLANEMNLVENYLYIQSRRFGGDLTYQLPTDLELLIYQDIKVPLLMFQIHVENAIEHGIRNNTETNGQGTIKVKIIDEDNILKIAIEDNGIGRMAASKIKSLGTQNGVKMLKELEFIFNSNNQNKIKQYYIDDIFERLDGTKYGTKTVIEIPKQYNYSL